MKRDIKPGDITQDLLRSTVPYFNEADPHNPAEKIYPEMKNSPVYGDINPETGEQYKTGPLMLRVWFLAGVVDLAASDPNLGWTPSDLNELWVTAVRDPLSPTTGAFITEEHWEWIRQQTRYPERMARQEFGQAFRDAAKGLFGGGGGGKPRGRSGGGKKR